MICDPTEIINDDLTLTCDDVPVGGIKSIYIGRFKEITLTKGTDADEGLITAFTADPGTVVEIQFNDKDSFTQYTEELVAEDSGNRTNNCSLVAQFPSMNLDKRQALGKLAIPNQDYIVFLEYASGERIAVGTDFGMRVGGVNSATGAAKSDVNNYDLNLVGEERNLAFYIESDSVWNSIINN